MLQEGPRTLVGIATFDSAIHFYNLKRQLQQVKQLRFYCSTALWCLTSSWIIAISYLRSFYNQLFAGVIYYDFSSYEHQSSSYILVKGQEALVRNTVIHTHAKKKILFVHIIFIILNSFARKSFLQLPANKKPPPWKAPNPTRRDGMEDDKFKLDPQTRRKMSLRNSQMGQVSKCVHPPHACK